VIFMDDRQVDELYRSGVKPWNSAGWTPHLTEKLHEKARGGRDSRE
jgi:SP family sugar:H+ symporter-like MFS transporter